MVISAKEFNKKKREEINQNFESDILKIGCLLNQYPLEIGHEYVLLGKLYVHDTLHHAIRERFRIEGWDLKFDGLEIKIKLYDDRIPDSYEGNRG